MSMNPKSQQVREALVKRFGSLSMAAVNIHCIQINGGQLLRLIEQAPGTIDPMVAAQIEVFTGIDLNSQSKAVA